MFQRNTNFNFSRHLRKIKKIIFLNFFLVFLLPFFGTPFIKRKKKKKVNILNIQYRTVKHSKRKPIGEKCFGNSTFFRHEKKKKLLPLIFNGFNIALANEIVSILILNQKLYNGKKLPENGEKHGKFCFWINFDFNVALIFFSDGKLDCFLESIFQNYFFFVLGVLRLFI